MLGNADKCGVWSVCRVADVCHCAGRLADSLADSEQPAALGSSVSAATAEMAFAARRAGFSLCPWTVEAFRRSTARRVADRDAGRGSSVFRTFESARFTFYTDCDPADARWAFQQLRPQNSKCIWDRPHSLRHLPTPRRAAIAALDDSAVTIEFSRAITNRDLVSISLRCR